MRCLGCGCQMWDLYYLGYDYRGLRYQGCSCLAMILRIYQSLLLNQVQAPALHHPNRNLQKVCWLKAYCLGCGWRFLCLLSFPCGCFRSFRLTLCSWIRLNLRLETTDNQERTLSKGL